MSWDIDDTVGAWVPHGRFVIDGQAVGPLAGLRFAVKDIFDVAGHPTGAGNPTWLATHPIPERHSAVVAQLSVSSEHSFRSVQEIPVPE